jgi:ADP-ribosylglycohydrolase
MIHELPTDHAARIGRARLALEGLSVGDAFGGRFFSPPDVSRTLPRPPWRYSDDTAMALSLLAVLDRRGRIEPDELARAFARSYRDDPDRGYGLSVRGVLESIAGGEPWSSAAVQIYGGMGSMGNGGAMRVAPLGAYFADDMGLLIEQARLSAAVTHAHPEGQAGAIAVAVASGWASNLDDSTRHGLGREMLEVVLEHTPAGETRSGIERALKLEFAATIEDAVSLLGNGSRITSPDTVPFALWCAARHLDDYAEALWAAATAGGDNDTNCAIVGGILGPANGLAGIPREWLDAREPLDWPETIIIKDSLASADRGEGCDMDEFFDELERELRTRSDP